MPSSLWQSEPSKTRSQASLSCESFLWALYHSIAKVTKASNYIRRPCLKNRKGKIHGEESVEEEKEEPSEGAGRGRRGGNKWAVNAGVRGHDEEESLQSTALTSKMAVGTEMKTDLHR